MDIVSEPEWETILRKLIENKGVTVLVGASDTGKTYLARYLIKGLLINNIKVSLIDTDIGQSSLAIPGTISMKTFKILNDLDDFSAEKMFFIGSVNAAKRISAIVEKTKKMVNLFKKESDAIIIDTTGLVEGDIGKKLKLSKIKTVMPNHLIAVQRNDELEHILSDVENVYIHRIHVSPHVKVRSREERISYRENRLKNYFEANITNEYTLERERVKFFYNDIELYMGDKYIIEGSVIGLNHDENTIALGMVIGSDSDSIIFKSPVKSLKRVNRVVLGEISI